MLTTFDARAHMSQLLTGFIPAQALAVAAELGLADRLSDGPKTSGELAQLTGTDARTLFRLMRFLASLGIFRADDAERFSLTPMAELLKSDATDSMRSMARIMGRIGPASVGRLLDGVRHGTCPFEEAFGQPLFDWLGAHPDEAILFDAAMNGFHGPETAAVLDAYPLDAVSTLADIGCGNGTALAAALRRHPSLRGMFFDQQHVIDRMRARIEQDAGLAGRYDFRSGSFFDAVPSGADAYFMRHIIHDWTDELSLTILGNVRRAVPSHGRLLIVEMIVPEDNEPSAAKGFDMMMMLIPKGLERTEREYRTLLGEAGFALHSVTPTASPVSVIDARPV
jgi:hypothetical protein